MHVTEHTSPCQHVREYFHATATGDDHVPLHLHIKRYTPSDDGQPAGAPRKGMTIIAAAANAVPKVCPLFPQPRGCCGALWAAQ